MVTIDLKTVSIFILGMKGKEHADQVKSLLQKVPGVTEVSVDATNNNVTVEYHPAQASFGRLINVLEGRGYSVGGFTSHNLEILDKYLPLKVRAVRAS